MTENLRESDKWFRPSPGSKLAARKARQYFMEPEKRVLYDWQVEVPPQPISVRGITRVVPVDLESTRSTTPEYVETVNKLIELLELPGGWNSYNARPISKENVTFVVGLLAQLMRATTPAPQVVPRVRGGVQLEWHTRGVDIEIAVDSPEEVSFFAEDHRSAQEPVEEEFDVGILSHWIDRLSGMTR